MTYRQWCIAKNGGGYTQMGVAKGLKVPWLFMITEESIRCQKKSEVGIQRIPAYTLQYTTAYRLVPTLLANYISSLIGADYTGATGNFAPVLTQGPGQTLRFAPVPFMAVL